METQGKMVCCKEAIGRCLLTKVLEREGQHRPADVDCSKHEGRGTCRRPKHRFASRVHGHAGMNFHAERAARHEGKIML